VAPTVPRTEKDNERLLPEIEKLTVKGEKNLSPEEDALLKLLTQLVETFERRVYPREGTSPAELVAFLLEQRGLPPSDLGRCLAPRAGCPSFSPADVRSATTRQSGWGRSFIFLRPRLFRSPSPQTRMILVSAPIRPDCQNRTGAVIQMLSAL
jgi:antitoxin component HigA of HigAB toxin-antitoxin module